MRKDPAVQFGDAKGDSLTSIENLEGLRSATS